MQLRFSHPGGLAADISQQRASSLSEGGNVQLVIIFKFRFIFWHFTVGPMANGKVLQLSWSQLRSRREHPSCVIDAIPAEDLHSFVRLMATHPLQSYHDAAVVRAKLLSVRHFRTELADVLLDS